MAAALVLRLRDGCRIFETADGQLAVATSAGETAIAGLPSDIRAALLRLNQGVDECQLMSAGAGLPLIFFALDQVTRAGALAYEVRGTKGPLATASPRTQLPAHTHVDRETRYVCSRFALVRQDGGRLVMETARSAARIVVDDPRVLTYFSAFATPRGIDQCAAESGLTSDEGVALATLLLRCGMIANEGEEREPLAWWSFHDALFHARSRFGRHQGGYGGTYPRRGAVEPLPLRKPAMSDQWIDLDRPDLERLRAADVPFTAVMENRRSTRVFGDPPIGLHRLGEFLYRAARDRSGEPAGGRPYPGGGAVYELEIYLSVDRCAGLPQGLYHYAPGEHRLYRLPASPEHVNSLLRDAAQSGPEAPQVLLTLAARFGRIFWKYESMGYALILKDVGALMQTFYLVAEAMGLGGCAVGGGDSDVFAAAAGLDSYEESSVGEFVIGSLAQEEP